MGNTLNAWDNDPVELPECKESNGPIMNLITTNLSGSFKVSPEIFRAMTLEMWLQGEIKVLKALKEAGYDVSQQVDMSVNDGYNDHTVSPLENAILSKSLECVKFAKEIGIECPNRMYIQVFLNDDIRFDPKFLEEVFKLYPETRTLLYPNTINRFIGCPPLIDKYFYLFDGCELRYRQKLLEYPIQYFWENIKTTERSEMMNRFIKQNVQFD